MRGKGVHGVLQELCCGITPAYAGKSVALWHMVVIVWDHPRVCGEKSYQDSQHGCQSGSPPRMRGKDANGLNMLSNLGITPAYAGKRPSRLRRDHERRDHPRVCGEKSIRVVQSSRCLRITPAYAGKRAQAWVHHPQVRDHPRVCGEKQIPQMKASRTRGSPPRMRGKVGKDAGGVSTWGITPAYAGKRLKRSRSTVPPVAIVPLFPSVCNKPVVSDGSPAGRDAPLFLPAENAVPASPAYNLRSL